MSDVRLRPVAAGRGPARSCLFVAANRRLATDRRPTAAPSSSLESLGRLLLFDPFLLGNFLRRSATPVPRAVAGAPEESRLRIATHLAGRDRPMRCAASSKKATSSEGGPRARQQRHDAGKRQPRDDVSIWHPPAPLLVDLLRSKGRRRQAARTSTARRTPRTCIPGSACQLRGVDRAASGSSTDA